MAKKLRKEPINIAPDIIGWISDFGEPIIIDERTNAKLVPYNIDHKIIIYERQVKEWFLKPATDLIKYKNQNKGFIVLMICLSYLEGVEQYRRGESSNGRSGEFFKSAIERIYPNRFSNRNLRDFYSEARCSLFHTGMVNGRIIINNSFGNSLKFVEQDIKISPSKFLTDIIADFESYLINLKTDQESRLKFDRMYSNT